jgi:glycosyltransferase involved in cell wall biosynthesis
MSRIQTRPLVSVIIPAYNADRFIAKTLYSVLGQTYSHFEVIVVDDGSCDRTAEIVRSISHQDRRVQLVQQQNRGVAIARNVGIARSRGIYIAPLDADDIWDPQKLEKQVARLEMSDPTVGLVYAWSSYIDVEGQVLGYYPAAQLGQPEGEVLITLVFSNFVDHGSNPLIRRSCIEHVGGYSRSLQGQTLESCEDWDFYLRLAEHYRFGLVPEYLMGYRQSVNSATANSVQLEQDWLLVLSEIVARHPEIPNKVQNWAKGSFYNYLLGKSYVNGDYRRVLLWLLKGVCADWIMLLRPGVYRALVVGMIRVLSVRSRREKPLKLPVPCGTPKRVWKPYDLLYRRRWRQVMRMTKGCKIAEFREELGVVRDLS